MRGRGGNPCDVIEGSGAGGANEPKMKRLPEITV